jgi:putative drug exporter of the RND superfamily
MLVALSRWCFQHRRATLLIWASLLVGAGALANVATTPAFSSSFDAPASESTIGLELAAERFDRVGDGMRSGTIVFTSDVGVDDDAVVAAMETMFGAVDRLDGVEVYSPYIAGSVGQVNSDRTVAFARVQLDESLERSDLEAVGAAIWELRPSMDGLSVEVGGQALAAFEPPKSELLGLGFAVLVLIAAFGSVLAMGLPIGVALFGVGVGVSVVALISHLTAIPEVATTLGAMLGIAVGIDYALFIVTRYREYLHAGFSVGDAVAAAMDTSGRAVVFAGATVVVSLLGMVLVGVGFVGGLGVGAAVTVAVTMAASVTLLPALLGFAGDRIEVTTWRGLLAAGAVAVGLFGLGLDKSSFLLAFPAAGVILIVGSVIPSLRRKVPPRRDVNPTDTLAYRWSRVVQARPVAALLVGTFVLLALAAPVLSLRLGFSDEGNYPAGTTTRRAYDLLADGFGPGFNGPLLIVGDLTDGGTLDDLADVARAVSQDPGVAFVAGPQPDDTGTVALIYTVLTTAPQDSATGATVERLRADVIGDAVSDNDVRVYVAGSTAAQIDFTRYLSGRLYVFIAAVLAVSFLLLAAVFRSLLVPLKAVVMNVVSIAAAYGVVVAVFQWGWGANLLGVAAAPVEPFVPMMMFAIVFGLSMDYEVFLLSRIREEFTVTGDAHGSVANGLAATARVITAAAAIMIVVFGAFLLEDDRTIKLFGVGLSAAVLLDATLVRMLLVPATMELLGARNWWLPTWLDRILPHLHVEGSSRDSEEPGSDGTSS